MNETLFELKLAKIKKKGERLKKEKKLRDAYAKYIPEKNKKKVSNIMLVIIVFAIIGYTVAAFWIQYTTGTPIDATLTTSWMAFWSIEIISLAAIKNSKTKHSADKNTY